MAAAQPTAQRADKPSRPDRKLSREAILDAALHLIDEAGFNALSMRRVAAELGVTPMALYGHVKTRADVVDSVTARALGIADIELESGLPWERQLILVMRRLRRALSQHPGVIDVLVAQFVQGPAMDHVRERLLGVFRSTGLSLQQSVDWAVALSSYTLGYSVMERARRRKSPADEFKRLRRLPKAEFPNLTRTARYFVDLASERAFERGLAALVKSIRSKADPTTVTTSVPARAGGYRG